MQAISDFCERLKAFFTKKPRIVLAIIDESKVLDENMDLEFRVPPMPTDSLDSEMLNLQTPSVPAQLPTALEPLAQQQLVCTAKDTDIQHSDENKSEDKQDVRPPSASQNDLD